MSCLEKTAQGLSSKDLLSSLYPTGIQSAKLDEPEGFYRSGQGTGPQDPSPCLQNALDAFLLQRTFQDEDCSSSLNLPQPVFWAQIAKGKKEGCKDVRAAFAILTATSAKEKHTQARLREASLTKPWNYFECGCPFPPPFPSRSSSFLQIQLWMVQVVPKRFEPGIETPRR